MEKTLKKFGVDTFSSVSFQHINTFPVRSFARIPADCASVLAIIYPYYNQKSFFGNLSAYCSVADYHNIVGLQLKSICEELKNRYPNHEFVPFVDASPFDEVDLCVKAGLGVRGINSLLITPKYGSFVFIGEIATTMKLQDVLYPEKSCCQCMACVQACPGQCIRHGKINSQHCASFISQKKGDLSAQEVAILKKAHTVFGCDICQLVCPHNQKICQEENLFSNDILNTISLQTVKDIYKQRAFGFRGLKVLERNLLIYEDLPTE